VIAILRCQYHYLVPANMFAVGALNRALALNEAVWHHDGFKAMATKLRDDVMDGIKKSHSTCIPNTTYTYSTHHSTSTIIP